MIQLTSVQSISKVNIGLFGRHGITLINRRHKLRTQHNERAVSGAWLTEERAAANDLSRGVVGEDEIEVGAS